jgi:DHA1 family multidrug resistance protein-like MFS transporter
MCSYNFVRNIEIPFVPILIEQIVGKETAAYWTGITSAFVSVGALLSGIFIGYAADKVKPQKIIVPAFIISIILLLLQAFSTNLWVFGISRTLMYFFLGGILPVLQKILSGVTPKQKRGKVFGWATTFNGLGLIAASGLGGGIVYLMGTRATFWVAAIAAAGLIPLCVNLTNRVMAMPLYIANTKKK